MNIWKLFTLSFLLLCSCGTDVTETSSEFEEMNKLYNQVMEKELEHHQVVALLEPSSPLPHGYDARCGPTVDSGSYGCVIGDQWCSEGYARALYLAGHHEVKDYVTYQQFVKYFKVKHADVELDKAEQGDYLGLDTNGNGKINHTGMFVQRLDETTVLTLEANRDRTFKYGTRDISEVIFVGSVRTAMERISP